MNILFITATRIGDAVLTTGLLAALAERSPQARITVAAGPEALPLFAAAPNVVRRIPLVKRRWSLHWFDLWRECIKVWWGWDLVVDLRGSLIAFFLLARRRRVYWGETGGRHRLYSLAGAVRISPPPAPRVWTTPEQEATAARLVPADGAVLALGPAAKWRAKTWRAENFVALMARLTGPEGIMPRARVAVFAAPDERERVRPVLEAVPAERLIDLAGTVDLATAGAALRRCALYVGNDSGLMHLAAAAGTPTLGLFGPGRPEIYAPWGEHTSVVRTPLPYKELFPRGRDPRTVETLMDGLTVDAVEEAAVELWCRSQTRL